MSEATRIHRRADRWWAAVRVALLAGWVLWVALSWWMAPRESTIAQARADAAAGRVVSYQTGAVWDGSGWRWGLPVPDLASRDDSLLFWETTDLRTHYAAPDSPAYEFPENATSASGWTVDAPVYIGVLAVVSGLIFLGILVNGPAPVTGTRWFWFWLVGGTPFALGLVYWLVRERPWSRTVTRPLAPAGRDPRRRWYLGIILAIAASLAADALILLLNRLLGDALVPSP